MEAILLEDEQESLRWVKELLNAGEDPNGLDYDCYYPPLYEAWGSGRTEIVRILLEHGAIISAKHNPLEDWTVGSVPIEATLLILDAGHSFKECVTIRNNEPMCSSGSNPLTYLLDHDLWEHVRIFEQYDLMCSLNAFNDLGLTPLAEMARDNKIIQARWLLDKNANVNAHCECLVGYTALEEAVHEKHLDMIKLLLDAGANPNIRTWMNVCCTERVQTIGPQKKKQRLDPSKRADLKEIKDLIIHASKKFPYEPS